MLLHSLMALKIVPSCRPVWMRDLMNTRKRNKRCKKCEKVLIITCAKPVWTTQLFLRARLQLTLEVPMRASCQYVLHELRNATKYVSSFTLKAEMSLLGMLSQRLAPDNRAFCSHNHHCRSEAKGSRKVSNVPPTPQKKTPNLKSS